MQRASLVLTGAILCVAAAMPSLAQSPATDPTMRILDSSSDAARVESELDGRRAEAERAAESSEQSRRARRRSSEDAAPERQAAAPPADRSAERRRYKLDEHDDERGESALDDDDIARTPPAPVATQ